MPAEKKLRLETSNFDIIFIDDLEANKLVLEKPLPAIKNPEVLIGTVCVYKKIENTKPYKFTYYYGTVVNVYHNYEIDPLTNEYKYNSNSMSIYCSFLDVKLSTDLIVSINYNPLRETCTINAKWMDDSSLQPADTPYITLSVTEDPSTGDNIYTGSATIRRNDTAALLTHGYILMMTSEPYIQSTNKIVGFWRNKNSSNQWVNHLILGSYFKFNSGEVRDVDITIGDTRENDTYYIGMETVPISVSFRVPAGI